MFRKFLLISLHLVLTTLACQATAALHTFSHVTTQDGLPSDYVRSIRLDSKGFLWIGTFNGLARYDGEEMRVFRCYDQQQQIGNDNIVTLAEHPSGCLLVGTDIGVFAFDATTETFRCVSQTYRWVNQLYVTSRGAVWCILPHDHVQCFTRSADGEWTVKKYHLTATDIPNSLYKDDDDGIWVGTEGQGLFFYEPQTDSFSPARSRDSKVVFEGHTIADMSQISPGVLAVATEDGLLASFDTRSHEFQPVAGIEDETRYIYDICSLHGEIWVANVNGLHIVDARTGQIRSYYNDPLWSMDLSDNDVCCLYRDPYDGMWIGTKFGGVNCYSPRRNPIKAYVHTSEATSPHSNLIRGLAEDADGRLWVGSEDPGISIYDFGTNEFHAPRMSLFSNNINDISSHGGKIWLGYFHQGLDVVTPGARSAYHETPDTSIVNHSVYASMTDSRGRQWIAMDRCAKYRNANESVWHPIAETGTVWIFGLMESADGEIWIATMGSGLWRFNADLTESHHYSLEARSLGLTTNNMSALMQDRKGRIWISTDRGGLLRYNPATDDFTAFGNEYGIADNTYNILEDQHGHLWFGTNHGLACFDPETCATQVYTMQQGLPSNQFNYHSACATCDGTFWMGTLGGLIAFRPEQVENTGDDIQLYISAYDATDKLLNATTTQQLKLAYDEASFRLHVAAPNFSSAVQSVLNYRIEPIDTQWRPLPEDHDLSFVNLAPGKYRVVIEASRGEQKKSISYTIHITPPWWNSIAARICYALLICLIFAGSLLYYRRLTRQRLAEHKKNYALKMEKSLNENKVQFFTEIAHEIRTPLSLIDAPLEAMEDYVESDRFIMSDGEISIEELKQNDAVMRNYIKTMRRNTRRLLDLTSQLLDFRKIKLHKLHLHQETIDVRALIEEVSERFRPSFELKQKNLTTEFSDETLLAFADGDALIKICSNLLNNALKYARREVSISLTHDEQNFRIVVRSDSEPISPSERDSIFDPFYQIDDDHKRAGGGVGIGLPLSRQLARQHNGDLYLMVGNDNQFIVEIPINWESLQQHAQEKLKEDRLVMNEIEDSKQHAGFALLLVEDNEEMLEFLSAQLSNHYTIFTAKNGREALDLLKYNPVDLILSDVMMPIMDGFQLCNAIKNDENTSNIPIVFLTAKNDTDTKVKGLQCGAEAYIEKPFSIKYLRQQLQSILDNRRRERLSFQKKPFFNIDNMKVSKQDEVFMQKVIHLIEVNMDDEEFSVDQLAEMLCMSRSTLLRRIKPLYGQSPLDLIRTVRLKKAAELIQKGNCKLAEVGYTVGISSPSYFSKLFFKQFGIMPRDFAAQCHNK